MTHQVPVVHARWILAAIVSLAAFGVSVSSAQTQDPLPSGVSVRLDLKGGKTNYLMGEPIVLQLTLSGKNADYVVNTVTMFGVSETINVTPADQIFRWHGTVSGDVIVFTPLSEAGFSIDLLLTQDPSLASSENRLPSGGAECAN